MPKIRFVPFAPVMYIDDMEKALDIKFKKFPQTQRVAIDWMRTHNGKQTIFDVINTRIINGEPFYGIKIPESNLGLAYQFPARYFEVIDPDPCNDRICTECEIGGCEELAH